MNEYFEGAIRQQQARGQRLLARIPLPSERPTELHVLMQTCQMQINGVLDRLAHLLKDKEMQKAEIQPERLRLFRRAVDYMNLLETTCITALERYTDNDDGFLNQLIRRIIHETAYPLVPPAVSALSPQYFHIYPQFKLLFVPLSEADFLLHLPDLYHELAHPLLAEPYNPRVKPFQKSFTEVLNVVLDHISAERSRKSRSRGPAEFADYLDVWERSWIDWTVEFFCDLFAVYTVGPAFVWAHLHLCAKLSEDLYFVPTFEPCTHPADHARMQTMLLGLRLNDFEDAANDIEMHWERLCNISSIKPEPEYQRCYPLTLLQLIATKAYEGVKGMKCSVISPELSQPTANLLNQAWQEFWRSPKTYSAWEQKANKDLRMLFTS